MKLVSCWRSLGAVALTLATLPVLAGSGPPTGGKVGPLAPVLVDTTGNGPTAGDMQIVPQKRGSDVTIPNPWNDCATKGEDCARYDRARSVPVE